MKKERKAQIASMERDCSLLNEIVEDFPIGSDKRRALRTAILTYSWLYLKDDLRAQFIHFQKHLYDPLTDEQLARLKEMGIDFGDQAS